MLKVKEPMSVMSEFMECQCLTNVHHQLRNVQLGI